MRFFLFFLFLLVTPLEEVDALTLVEKRPCQAFASSSRFLSCSLFFSSRSFSSLSLANFLLSALRSCSTSAGDRRAISRRK